MIDLTAILNLKRIDINNAIQNAVVDKESRIIELNQSQWNKGIKSDGESIGRYKRFSYKGRFEPVDLKLTGDFRRAENLVISNTGFDFEDSDSKAPFLSKKYGAGILGLTEENKGVAAALLTPKVVENIKYQLA